jgi:hypothetical protein
MFHNFSRGAFMLSNKSFFKTFLFGMSLLLFSSCAREYHVVSTSFADSSEIPCGFPIGSSFYVATLDKLADKTSLNPLLDREIINKVERLLENKGYFVERNQKHADYILAISFSVTKSKELVNVTHHIPGETSTTYGRGTFGKYEETTTTSGTSVSVPELQTFFTKQIQLRVFDSALYKSDKTTDDTQVWHGEASNCDQDSDFRVTVDYLLIAAFRNFGKNTYKKVHTRVYSDDKDVKKLYHHAVN